MFQQFMRNYVADVIFETQEDMDNYIIHIIFEDFNRLEIHHLIGMALGDNSEEIMKLLKGKAFHTISLSRIYDLESKKLIDTICFINQTQTFEYRVDAQYGGRDGGIKLLQSNN